MSGEQKVTYASRSQLTMKMNGDTYQYRFVIGDFTGDFTDEEKKILHIYVMYMVQTAIKMHQMANRIRLTQPDENEWWMNVECTVDGLYSQKRSFEGAKDENEHQNMPR